jgi:hypothetical protein
MEYLAQCGDIFLSDSDRSGAKMVKFLQTAPTVYQYIWRAIRNTQQPVNYYHAGMVLDQTNIVEQQWKFQYGLTAKILPRKVVIYRLRGLTDHDREYLRDKAWSDLGHTYGLALILGKTLTWLTGINWFQQFLGKEFSKTEICVTQVARVYQDNCKFGVKRYQEVTTKIIDEWCSNPLNGWEVVYRNG